MSKDILSLLEMKLEITKETGECLPAAGIYQLAVGSALLTSHSLTGRFLCPDLIEYRKPSNGSYMWLAKGIRYIYIGDS